MADLDDRLVALGDVPARLPSEDLQEALRRIGNVIVHCQRTCRGPPRAVRSQIMQSRPALLSAAFVRLWTAHATFPDQLDEIMSAAVVDGGLELVDTR
jgi:hypothetical protein